MADEMIKELWEIKGSVSNDHGYGVTALVARLRAKKYLKDRPKE